jgi:hypothetical protein
VLAVFNEKVAKVPGLYNENARFKIEFSPYNQYDFFNLTANERT